MNKFQVNIHDLGDASAVAFASNKKNDQRVKISLMLWDVVRCANCGHPMSLFDATYNEKFAPIHKNCEVIFYG